MDCDTLTPTSLEEKLKKIPKKPGIYLWKDKKGAVIYVGKAKVLANRVRSYLQIKGKDIKTRLLIVNICDLDWIVTDSENEALILENTLIKKYRPRYNIRLMDDKNYVCLRLGKEDFPRISIVRKIKPDKATYYGPFSSSRAVRTTLRFLNKNFPLRKCNDRNFASRTRPCMFHQIGQCHAPCVGKISKEEYAKIVRHVNLFFDGQAELLTGEMNAEMLDAAELLEFERAAKLRNAIYAIKKTLERQKTVSADFTDRDVFGIYREGGSAVVSILYVRRGALFGHQTFPLSGMEYPAEEILASVIKQYYSRENFIPREIYVSCDLGSEGQVIESWMSETAGHKVRILRPVRGRKKELPALADKNAKTQFQARRNQIHDAQMVLEKVQKRLHLSQYPRLIECFDISNIQGTNQVAGQVRFVDGEPDKSGYRMYKIRTVKGQDDFASMKEVLSRRFAKSRDEAPYPDLVMIDGGKGQLNMALAALRELKIALPDVIGFTKIRKPGVDEAEDMVYLPGRKNPVRFVRGGDDLFLLQRIRDESHRFAIEYHRKLRMKSMKKSILDEIPGIGPVKRKALIKKFGSVKRIQLAGVEKIAETKGFSMDLAEKLFEHLKEGSGEA